MDIFMSISLFSTVMIAKQRDTVEAELQAIYTINIHILDLF